MMCQWCEMRLVREGGKVVLDGRMRRMSQWMFCARREEVERVVGRTIQRMTREMTIGVMGAEERVSRKVWIVVEGVREIRWRVRRGIFGR